MLTDERVGRRIVVGLRHPGDRVERVDEDLFWIEMLASGAEALMVRIRELPMVGIRPGSPSSVAPEQVTTPPARCR